MSFAGSRWSAAERQSDHLAFLFSLLAGPHQSARDGALIRAKHSSGALRRDGSRESKASPGPPLGLPGGK
jgi:hypothetical protein